MRVLVTGTTGHVGGAIARSLVALGYDVTGLARRPTAGLSGAVALELGTPEFLDAVKTQVARCDAIVHAAAQIEVSPKPEDMARTNCLGTHQIAALAKDWGVERLINISSIAVEGRPQVLPMTESHPLAPATPYAASKLYGECVVATSGLAAVSLRITSPVGPGLVHRRIFRIFVERALRGNPITVGGQGSRRQNYVDVRDIAAAVETLLHTEHRGVYHIAGTTSISNLELARACVGALDSTSSVTCDGITNDQEGLDWAVSSARAYEAFGYAPRYSLKDSILALAAEV